MAVNILNTTTLSEALTASTQDFTVAATTNISVGDLLVVRGECFKVQEIPVSGRVRVMRGVNGTKARQHASGTLVYIGSTNAFKAIKDSLTALVGDAGVYPDYLLPGQRARDGAGNEYVMVELTQVCYSGTTVRISTDGLFTAAPLAVGDQGSVGLLVEPGSSDQYAWAQIYGYNAFAQDTLGDSSGTSTRLALAATAASTPSVGMAATSRSSFTSAVGVGGTAQNVIQGMFIVGAATTATTSATSATGVAYPVWLNYPFIKLYGEATAVSS